MKNKPDPALLRPSNLSNEITKKGTKISWDYPFKKELVLNESFIFLVFFDSTVWIHDNKLSK
jgi:hypothetical protein